MMSAPARLTFEAGQITGHKWEQVDAMIEAVRTWQPHCIAIERFDLRAGLHRGAASRRETLDPVRVTEAFIYGMYALRSADRAIGRRWAGESAYVWQFPADAKGYATDERLKRWGLYVPRDHARDAMRHAILHLSKDRACPSVLAFDPGGTTGWACVRRVLESSVSNSDW